MKKLLLIFTLLLSLLPVWGQQTEHPYVVVIDNDAEMEISDSTFYSIARSVVFPSAKWNISASNPFRKELENEILPQVAEQGLVLRGIKLRGAASPEGKYSFNKFLGEHRLASIINLLKDAGVCVDDCEQLYNADTEAEDYEYLLMMMREHNDPDYDVVAEMVKRHGKDIASLKNELRRYKNFALWNRLFKEYFPELRAARVVLFFGTPQDAKPSLDKLVQDSLRLAAEKAEQARQDSIKRAHDMAEALRLEELQRIQHEQFVQNLGDATIFPVTPVAPVTPVVPDNKEPRRELLSIKTNLLFDFAYVPLGYDRWCPIPNVAIEYYPLKGHFTYGASFDCPWWQHYWQHKYFQIRNYQVHTRYYFRSGDINKRGIGNGAAFKGFYVSAYVHAGLFDICFDENRGWEGEGGGAGLGVGYVLPLGKKEHWRLEFGLQGGFFRCQYDPYQWECPVNPSEQDHLYYYKWTGKAEDFQKRQYRYNWLGPTRAEITLSYDLLYRRNHKKGVSFRNWEPAVKELIDDVNTMNK